MSSSLVPDAPFLDPQLFPWTVEVERRWREIRIELDRVLELRNDLPNFHDISAAQSALTNDDGWKVFIFFGFMRRVEANCLLCPRTAEVLDEVPGLVTAFFSILSPGKRIPPHRGPYRGLLRYHLGLLVPDGSSVGITVGGEVRRWSEGKSMLFDDGYEHFAWNDSAQIRAVLFVDIVRPFRRAAAAVNGGVLRGMRLTPYVRNARRRQERWTRRQK